MKELFQYFANMGWFSGTLVVTFKMESAFEGYSGRASETWEQRYVCECEGIRRDNGWWLVEPFRYTSTARQNPDEFALIVLNKLKQQKQP